MTSKRYQKETEPRSNGGFVKKGELPIEIQIQRQKNLRRKQRSEERRFGTLQPWEQALVDRMNNPGDCPESWLACHICREVSEDVVPRQIIGIGNRLSSQIPPMADLCCHCAGEISNGRIDLLKIFGCGYRLTGEPIGVRVLGRAEFVEDERPINSFIKSLQGVAEQVDGQSVGYRLKRQFGRS
jgi:hypothetical protein